MPLELLFPLNIGNTSELLLTTLFITTRSIVIQMAWGYTNSFPKLTIEVIKYLQCLENRYFEGICCGLSRKNLNSNSVRQLTDSIHEVSFFTFYLLECPTACI